MKAKTQGQARAAITALIALGSFAAPAFAADPANWRTVEPGVMEQLGADGTVTRLATGKAGAEYTLRQLKTRIDALQNDLAKRGETASNKQMLELQQEMTVVLHALEANYAEDARKLAKPLEIARRSETEAAGSQKGGDQIVLPVCNNLARFTIEKDSASDWEPLRITAELVPTEITTPQGTTARPAAPVENLVSSAIHVKSPTTGRMVPFIQHSQNNYPAKAQSVLNRMIGGSCQINARMDMLARCFDGTHQYLAVARDYPNCF